MTIAADLEKSYGAIRKRFFPPARPIVKADMSGPQRMITALEAEKLRLIAALHDAESRRDDELVAAIERAIREPRRTALDIAREVAMEYGLESWRDMLKSKANSRRRPYFIARQVAMYRMHQELNMSLPRIARFFGGYDHTTVLHALASVEKRARGA